MTGLLNDTYMFYHYTYPMFKYIRPTIETSSFCTDIIHKQIVYFFNSHTFSNAILPKLLITCFLIKEKRAL